LLHFTENIELAGNGLFSVARVEEKALRIQGNGSIPVSQARQTTSGCLAKHGKNRLLTGAKALIHKGDRGGALVEMAVTLPVIFLIMTGIFSFSIALYQKLELAQAVSVGSRFLATDRGDTDPCASTATKVYAASPSLSQSAMTFSIALTNGTTTTTYSTPTCSGAVMTTGGTALLKVSYPCTLSVYGANFGSCTLATQVSEVIQ
jgi:Flp pilus assembly protein TadG